MATQFRGVIPPVVTPLTADGEVDKVSFARSLNRMIDAGVDHAVERTREADLVDFAVGGERGDDRGDDPAELCCHDGGSFTKPSYSDNGRPLPSTPLKEANGGMAKR